jgi:hypothetical protein
VLSRGRFAAAALLILATPWVVSNATVYFVIAHEIQPYAVPFGLERRNEFLERRLTSQTAFQWLNDDLQPGEKVALLAEQRTYRLRVPFIASNFFGLSQIGVWSSELSDAKNLLSILQENGITHILVNVGELERMGGWQRFSFSNAGEVNFKALIKEHAHAVGEERNVQLFRLLFN